MSEARLWEVEHDYYCEQGNYFASGSSRNSVEYVFESWADFMEEFGDADLNRNLVFRWDWLPADVEDDDCGVDELLIFFMGQRKGKYYFARVVGIRREDEADVRAWLQPRFEHLVKLWSPLGVMTECKAGDTNEQKIQEASPVSRNTLQ